MSTNLNYKQASNVSRRTWDVEEYEKKARARQAASEELTSSSNKRARGDDATTATTPGDAGDGAAVETKEEFAPAQKGAACPEGSKRAFLKARRGKIDVEGKVGTTEIISAEAAARTTTEASVGDSTGGAAPDNGCVKTGVGWHCKVCDCFLKDSMTYLDHINGRKHQAKLGYSMRVERSTKDQLLSKLSQLTKKKEEQGGTGIEALANNEPVDYNDLVKKKDDEEKRRKEERRRKRKERKKRMQEQDKEEEEEEEEGVDGTEKQGEDGEDEEQVKAAEVDPALAQMMGFSGFGGS